MADIYLNLRAFQATAAWGNFSRAARMLGAAPSVVTKRVNQLEDQLGTTLFRRSTRSLTLTEAGRRYLERSRALTLQIDELLSLEHDRTELEDFLRVKAPTTMTLLYLKNAFHAFLSRHPRVRMELVLIDRAVDPASEGFDLAIGAFPRSFGDATDEPLCRLRRLLCAAPDYLARKGTPSHPKDLVHHDCLSFVPTGQTWHFHSDKGPITIEVSPKFSANDGQVITDLAKAGIGIAIVSEYAARRQVDEGALVPILQEFQLPDMWFKAVAPDSRKDAPAVRLLVEELRRMLTPVPPWETARM
jgi:DNA-binding transcriptional LysR family regulator